MCICVHVCICECVYIGVRMRECVCVGVRVCVCDTTCILISRRHTVCMYVRVCSRARVFAAACLPISQRAKRLFLIILNAPHPPFSSLALISLPLSISPLSPGLQRSNYPRQ